MAARRVNTMAKARSLAAGNLKSPSLIMLADMREAVQQAADFLRSIGSAHRLMILCLLTDGAKSVTQLCDAIDARQSLVSQHLTRLRLDGLVQANRQGHFVHYSLTDTPAKEIVAILHRHFCPDRPGAAKN
jgi:ArsR family transcriptional regulator, virulence genes transcriptional regulator